MESIPTPVLSVLIITYQHVGFIRDAIEGVLMQKTNFPFEIIIGDDDSNDGTREICIEYAKKYPEKIRLFLHKRENNMKILGKPCLIFQFLYNCFSLRGPLMTGVSGDDYWTDETKLQKQYDFLSNNPDFSMCYHKWSIKNENEKNNVRLVQGTSARAHTLMYTNIYTDIPEQFAEVIAEDTFTKFILSTIGKKKYIKNIEPAIYREHSGSIWSLSSEKFKHDIETLSAQKMLEAYKGTRYQAKLEALFFARVVMRKFVLLRDDNTNLAQYFIQIIKETLKHPITYKFPFKFQIYNYVFSFRFFFTLTLIALNNMKWKFKYSFKI